MSKISVNTARERGKSRFDVGSTHITTLDVGQLRPTYILPLVKGDSISGSFTEFTRMSPLVVPTYGSFALKSMAFFVPIRSIWKDFEGYISRSVDTTISGDAPNFKLIGLMDLLMTLSDGTPQSSSNVYAGWDSFYTGHGGKYLVDTTSSNPDMLVKSGNDQVAFMFTNEGRWLYNTLTSLGYEFPLLLNDTNWFGNADANDFLFSALPLLAYAKCLYDYVYPSQYVQQQGFGFLFKREWDNSTIDVTTWLPKLCELFFCSFDQDFFNSCWVSPNQVAAGSGASSISSFSQPGMNNNTGSHVNSVSSGSLSSTVSRNSNSSTFVLSSSALRWLQSVNDYVLRNNIGGTRFQEWMKSHFGYSSAPERHDLSVFIKSWTDTMQIGDVTSVAGTTSTGLGEQGGKGYGSVSGDISFEADEFGFLVFISSLVPYTGYYQGVKPFSRGITSPFDFYTPEFDGVGMEAIPMSDVYMGDHPASNVASTQFTGVFGFAPRYSNMYKRGCDFLTGDFRLRSKGGAGTPSSPSALDSYHTFRNLDGNACTLDSSFLQVDDQFDRIFAQYGTGQTGAYYDKFFTVFRFNLTKYSHMKSLSDSLPLFDRSGDSTTLNYEGTQLN